MREHYSLDRLVEYAVGPVPETVSVVNPARRKLESGIRAPTAEVNRGKAQFGALSMEGPLEAEPMTHYKIRKSELHEKIPDLQQALNKLKGERKQTPQRIAMKDLPEPDRFQRLLPERKHFVDTIKLIAYRAETSMAWVLRDRLARKDDARALLRHIFHNEVDLAPDLQAKTLTVRLHHLAQNAHDVAVGHLCDQLNATDTIFPGTNLHLVYELGSK